VFNDSVSVVVTRVSWPEAPGSGIYALAWEVYPIIALDDEYITEMYYKEMLQTADSLAKRLRGFSKHLSSS